MRITGKSKSLQHASCIKCITCNTCINTCTHVFTVPPSGQRFLWDLRLMAILADICNFYLFSSQKHRCPSLLCSRSFGLISARPAALQPLFYPSLQSLYLLPLTQDRDGPTAPSPIQCSSLVFVQTSPKMHTRKF